jgi:hypothetical protein
MAKEEFSIKTMFQTRLSPEETDEIQEAIIELVPDIDPERLNNHVLFMRIFRLALGNAKKIFVQRPEDTAAIQNLTNEIGRLKTLVDFKDSQIEDKEIHLKQLREWSEEVASTRTVVGENDILVQLSPLFKLVLKLEAASLKKKTGKDYTAQDILIEAYKEIGITGGRNIPFRQWSAADYKKVESTLNTPVAQ